MSNLRTFIREVKRLPYVMDATMRGQEGQVFLVGSDDPIRIQEDLDNDLYAKAPHDSGWVYLGTPAESLNNFGYYYRTSLVANAALEEQVIRLAYTKPELRSHLLPLLEKTSSMSLQEKKRLFPNLIEEIKKRLNKYPEISLGKVEKYKAALTYTGEGGDLLFHVLISPDANIDLMLGNSKIITYDVQRQGHELWRYARGILDLIRDKGRRTFY